MLVYACPAGREMAAETRDSRRRRRRRRRRVYLNRNESPFGVAPQVLQGLERQRTADRTKYGLNRYPDFLQTDLVEALQAYHGLTLLNYTPLAGLGEAGTVLAAALFRSGGQLVAPDPIGEPIGKPVVAWGGSVRRVQLAGGVRQDLAGLAAAVGPRTRLVHLQNPHDPTGQSFGQSELEEFLDAVAARNPDTYVWVDESYAPYSLRDDFPDSFAIIGRDSRASRLAVFRSLNTAHGLAGLPTGYLAASEELSSETQGIGKGYFTGKPYGWTQEANVNRFGEKALLALLTPEGDAYLEGVRDRNRQARDELVEILQRRRFRVVTSDASYVFCRPPGRYRRSGLGPALRKRGVLIRGSRSWPRRYRGWVRISVGTPSEQRRLNAELRRVLRRRRRRRRRGRRSAAPVVAGGSARATRRALVGGALAAGAVRVAAPALLQMGEPDLRTGISRRDFVRRAGLGAAGAAVLLGAAPRAAGAFPPDSFYDTFNLARLLYHENPVGPSPAALEAVREVLGRGPRCARRYEEQDQHDLVDAILRYNRPRSRAVRRLDRRNVMLLVGSAEGLFLTADAFVAGGTIVGPWPAYRIIRERVIQQGGTVVDVPLDTRTQGPDYPALRKALADHPETGLIRFEGQDNPVGTVLERGDFDDFAEHVFRNHPKTVILVDDSDREYMDPGYDERMPDFFRYVARGKNLIHLQTFSHIFGLTGLRVGYLMAPRRLIRELRRKRIARPVNVFGHAAALASLRDPDDQIRRSYQTVAEGRRYIYAELDKLGLEYQRSQGQYIFHDTGRSGTAVWTGLIGLGVLTRYGREWGREGWIRVCPGLPEENERFIAALRTVLNEPDPGNLPDLPVPIDKLLPPSAEGRALAAGLSRGLARDTWIESRTPPLERPYRVVRVR
jgi:histidinol-phosphate aminotransferase